MGIMLLAFAVLVLGCMLWEIAKARSSGAVLVAIANAIADIWGVIRSLTPGASKKVAPKSTGDDGA
jgi:hypothetical protein